MTEKQEDLIERMIRLGGEAHERGDLAAAVGYLHAGHVVGAALRNQGKRPNTGPLCQLRNKIARRLVVEAGEEADNLGPRLRSDLMAFNREEVPDDQQP